MGMREMVFWRHKTPHPKHEKRDAQRGVVLITKYQWRERASAHPSKSPPPGTHIVAGRPERHSEGNIRMRII
jgi:hypothetical protein